MPHDLQRSDTFDTLFAKKTLSQLEITVLNFSGHNQRLEFLGDTVLQIVASEYLFKYFPEHHEGHLSVSVVCIHKQELSSALRC